MNSLSGAELFSGHRLFSPVLLHHEPLALLIGETECAHGSSFGGLAGWGFDNPEGLRLFSD